MAMPLVALVTAVIVAVGIYSFVGLLHQERARRENFRASD